MHEKEQLLQIQREHLMRQLEQTSQLQSTISIERHDLRHRFHTLSAMLSDGRVDDAISYLKTSDESIASSELLHWCKKHCFGHSLFLLFFHGAGRRYSRRG